MQRLGGLSPTTHSKVRMESYLVSRDLQGKIGPPWVLWPQRNGWRGRDDRGGTEHLEGTAHKPDHPSPDPDSESSGLRAAAFRYMVSSALLNFIIFIKLMYTSPCGHLIKTFPRAPCRLLNEAGAAGLRFRASRGGEVSERDLGGCPGFPPSHGPGL